MVYFYVIGNLILFGIFPYLYLYIHIFIFIYVLRWCLYISPWLIYLGRNCHKKFSFVTFFFHGKLFSEVSCCFSGCVCVLLSWSFFFLFPSLLILCAVFISLQVGLGLIFCWLEIKISYFGVVYQFLSVGMELVVIKVFLFIILYI